MLSASFHSYIYTSSFTSTSTCTSASLSSSFLFGVLRYPSPFPSNFAGLSFLNSHTPSLTSRRFSIIFGQQQHHDANHGYANVVGRGGPSCMKCPSHGHGQIQHLNPLPALQLQSHSMSMSAQARRMACAEAGADNPNPNRTPSPTCSADHPFKDCSESESDAEEGDDGIGDVERWDVLGLGQAMVDFSGIVNDEFLESLGLEKGTRKLVNHEERGKVLRAMDGCSYKAAAGGSLSNSLVALARLGSQPAGGPVLHVAMAGSVGSDPLGGFYRAKLQRASVNFLSAPVKDGTTGTVIVLTTPDAQRTMLAYQGTSSTLNYDPGLSNLIAKTNILVVEGYLFELPDTIRTIARACKDAHNSGALVAVTASDVSCIERHYDDFWEIIGNYADIVFANSDEARALCNFSLKESPESTTSYLSHFVPFVSVTDGPRGSYIGVRGEAVYIPPSPCAPVDTCGAGDAYASGILYSILRGVSDLKGIGMLAARVAAVVVGQQGTRLRVQDAIELAESFACHLENSAI